MIVSLSYVDYASDFWEASLFLLMLGGFPIVLFCILLVSYAAFGVKNATSFNKWAKTTYGTIGATVH